MSVSGVETSADKEECVYCERGEVSRERFQLMNIHQPNDGSGQITIKALQAPRERFYYPGRFIIQTPLKWLKSRRSAAPSRRAGQGVFMAGWGGGQRLAANTASPVDVCVSLMKIGQDSEAGV